MQNRDTPPSVPLPEVFAKPWPPAPVGGGFAMEDYWIWCGSVAKGEDGRYHMFSSRWPRSLQFSHWAVASEVVRAVSDRPEGPYEFAEVVLPARPDMEAFDNRVTHNPCIVRAGDRWLLFYTGTTYQGATPTAEDPGSWAGRRSMEAWHNKRVGMATASRITGPWTRPTETILPTRPDRWDSVITSNPAACVTPEGGILLLYKSTADRHNEDGRFLGRFRIGVALAKDPDSPFARPRQDPILQFDDPTAHVEDPFVWHQDGRYWAIMKDMNGVLCGDPEAGIAASSADGIHWALTDPPTAYTRTIHWSDGTTTRPRKMERPQILFHNGQPSHLFFATNNATEESRQATRTWNMVRPLQIQPAD